MRKLKRINKNSRGYKAVQGGIGLAAELGGAVAVDCAVLPWIFAVCQDSKLKSLKWLGWLGTLGLSEQFGRIAKTGVDNIVDAYVECWNVLPFVEDEDEAIDITEASDEANEASNNHPSSINDRFEVDLAVTENLIFSFDNEAAAKITGEWIRAQFSALGKDHVTIKDYLEFRQMDPTIVPFADRFGWTKDLKEVGIEKVAENKYVLDLFDYDYVGFVTIDQVSED